MSDTTTTTTTTTSAEQTHVAVYGDEHGELYFEVKGETPGDVVRSSDELLRELHELIDNADAEGTTRYRLVITRTPEPRVHRLDRAEYGDVR